MLSRLHQALLVSSVGYLTAMHRACRCSARLSLLSTLPERHSIRTLCQSTARIKASKSPATTQHQGWWVGTSCAQLTHAYCWKDCGCTSERCDSAAGPTETKLETPCAPGTCLLPVLNVVIAKQTYPKFCIFIQVQSMHRSQHNVQPNIVSSPQMMLVE